MKKKILATLLALVMVLGMLPVSAFAAEGDAPHVIPAPIADHPNAPGDPDTDVTSTGLGTVRVTTPPTLVTGTEKTYSLTLTGTDIVKHKNASGAEGYWVGFGMPIENNETVYKYLVGGEKVASIADRKYQDDSQWYNTIYFDEAGTYTVVQQKVEGGNPTPVATYVVTVEINKKPIEVVPANLTTAAGKPAPGYGHVDEYNVDFLLGNDSLIVVSASDLQPTANSEGATAYWVGIGLTQLEGATYAAGWGENVPVDAEYEAADSSQVVDGVTYDTLYWGVHANDGWDKDENQFGYVSVKDKYGNVTNYTVSFIVDTAILGSEMALSKMAAGGDPGAPGRFNYLLRVDRYAQLKNVVINIKGATDGEEYVNYNFGDTSTPVGGIGFEWSLRKLQADNEGYSITGAEATEWEAKNSNVVPAGKYTVKIEATPFANQETKVTKEYEIEITEDMRKNVMVERTITPTVTGATATVSCTAAGSPEKLYGGEVVTVNVTDIQYGYELDKIEVDGVAITGTTFTMPADSNAAVTVTLKKSALPSATLQYTSVADTSIVSDCADDTMWVTFERPLPKGTHLWFVIEGGGKTYGIAADSDESEDTTIKFAWSFLNNVQFEKWAKDSNGADVALGSTPGATYTVKGYEIDETGDESTTVTEAQKFGEWTVTVPEQKVEAPGKTVVDASELPEDMSDEDVTAVTNAAASVEVKPASKAVLTTAANDVVKDVVVGGTEAAIDEAKTAALEDVGLEISEETKIVYVPALEVTPKDYTTDGETKTLEVDISAVLNAVVTAESTEVNDIEIKTSEDDDNENANAAIIIGKSAPLTIDKPIQLSITLPTGFTDPGPIYVKHVKNGTHYHEATVENVNGDLVATFTSDDGLSPFIFMSEASPAAKIGGTYYDTLQEAVDAVKDGETITLVDAIGADVVAEVKGSTSKTFTIDSDGKTFNPATNVKPAATAIEGETNKYSVAYTAPGSGGGGGGAGEPEKPVFTDVPADAYYADAVAWAVEKGITEGRTPTTFVPNGLCTRAEIVTFLWRAAGSPKATGSNPFTDVKSGDYYYDAVLWAVANKITVGTTDTTFSPNVTCTRAQAVTFLHRYEKEPAGTGSNKFTDVAAGQYYANAVQWAVNKGVTVGTTDTTFSPANTCTRGQIVTFLYRDMAK